VGDVARRDAIGIHLEDSSHDLPLDRIDVPQTPNTVTIGVTLLGKLVSVGETRRCLALLHRCLHALARPEADLIDQFIAQGRTEMEFQLRDGQAGMNSPDLGVLVV
jgi:hypothetical protein